MNATATEAAPNAAPQISENDIWHVAVNTAIDLKSPVYFVRDENGLEVAICGTRKDDAETIARHHNAHEPLFIALADLVMLAAQHDGGAMRDSVQRARQVLARWAP